MTVYAFAADGTRSIVTAEEVAVEAPVAAVVEETPEAEEAPAPAKRQTKSKFTSQETADPVVTDEPAEDAS